MLEGRRFEQNALTELVQFGVYHVLSPYMEKGTTFYKYWGKPEPTPEVEDVEAAEAARAERMRLWRKIQSAPIARQEVIGTFAGRGK